MKYIVTLVKFYCCYQLHWSGNGKVIRNILSFATNINSLFPAFCQWKRSFVAWHSICLRSILSNWSVFHEPDQENAICHAFTNWTLNFERSVAIHVLFTNHLKWPTVRKHLTELWIFKHFPKIKQKHTARKSQSAYDEMTTKELILNESKNMCKMWNTRKTTKK